MSFSNQALQPIYNLPTNYKQGGKISVASNTTLSVTACLTRSLPNNLDINIGDYFGENAGPNATIINGAVNGLNGLDTGTLAASKVYAVYAIADQAGYNPSGLLLSLSTSTPQLPNGTFPSNYNSYKRIGWAVTDSSVHFLVINCSGDGSTVEYTYDAPVTVLSAGTSATQAAVDVSTVIPAVSFMPVRLGTLFTPNAAKDTAKLCASGGTIASSKEVITGQVAAVAITPTMNIKVALISGVPKVDYILSTASASLSLYVNGFTDYLL